MDFYSNIIRYNNLSIIYHRNNGCNDDIFIVFKNYYSSATRHIKFGMRYFPDEMLYLWYNRCKNLKGWLENNYNKILG